MVVQRLRFYGAICAANLVLCSLLITSGDAVEGPNQVTESDFAAGQLIDSLFDKELPAPSNRKANQRRKTTSRRAALRGKLVDNPNFREGSPPYALVNSQGQVLRYVENVEDIDLELYRGETLAVRRDTGRVLLANQLVLPKLASREITQLLAFDEPTPANEADPIPVEEVIAEDVVADEFDGEESVLTPNSDQPFDESDQGPVLYDEGAIESYGGEIDFGGCSQCGSGTCGGCAMPGRGVMYAHGEYLLWWFDGMLTPPLVIADDNANFSSPEIVYGGNRILEDVRHGGRLTLGLWLDECGTWGLEGDYLGLGKLEESVTFGGNDGVPGPTGLFIGRPFFNTVEFDNGTTTVPRGPVQEEVDTQRLDGFVTINTFSEFQSAGIRLRHALCFAPGCSDPCCGDQVSCGTYVNCGSGCGSGWPFGGPLGRLCGLIKNGDRRTDVIYGFRWARLREGLAIHEDLEIVGTQDPNVGTQFLVNDIFETSNDFYGGEVGFIMGWQRCRWSLDFLSKIAIGSTRQRVAIDGSTFVFDPENGNSSGQGGLLTQKYENQDAGLSVGNIGVYERDEFSMIPEIGATLGYCLTPRLKLTAGYSLLYWSNVVRPGDQIDIDVNGNLIPSTGVDSDEIVNGDHPRFNFRQTDLWAHGINLGGEYSW